MERVTAVSTATAVADVLREEILGRRDDDMYLGQEDELLRRLGVSRPSLRQAVRLLQAEGILSVRRGHRGGLYGQRPDAAGVAHVASVFLRTRRASMADITRAYGVITAECAALAAAHPDEAERARLLAFVDEVDGAELREHLRARGRWGMLLAEIARSPTLQLFEDVLGALSRFPPARPLLQDPAEVAGVLDRWRRVARAVLDGDGELAARVCRENTAVVLAWLDRHPEAQLGW